MWTFWVINFGKLEWFAFMSTFTSFAQNPGFSCSVHLAGRQFLHRKLRFLHSSLTEYFGKSIFKFWFCNISQKLLYLNGLMIETSLYFLWCEEFPISGLVQYDNKWETDS